MSHEALGADAVAPGSSRRLDKPADTAALCHVTLTLARCPAYPEGSAGRGYDIVAPLGPDGRLDAALWHDSRDRCRVRRFWTGEPDRPGRLVHRAGGEGGATWLIDYDDRTDADDEPGYRLGSHTFVAGEYIAIREAGDAAYQTFRIDHVGGPGAGRPTCRSS